MSPLSSSAFANIFGPLEICLTISAVLNGCLLTQVISYFSRFRSDPLGFKIVIAAIWLGTAASFGCSFWGIYHIDITQHGIQAIHELKFPMGFFQTITLGVLVHAMVQGVYIYRIYTLGRGIFLLSISCILVMAEIGLAFVWFAAVARTMNIFQLARASAEKSGFISSVLGLGALLDVILAVSMCLQLRKNCTDGLKRTTRIVNTLTRWTIEGGMATCLVALIALVEWLANGRTTLWVGLALCLTDCYALTLMLLMNGRAHLSVSQEFTLSSVPITTMLLVSNHHSRASRLPPPAEC